MYCVGGVYVCMFASLNNKLNIKEHDYNTKERTKRDH
jgi:hypothetical protein